MKYLLVFLVCVMTAIGQVNTEEMRSSDSKTTLEFAYNAQKGNSDLTVYDLSGTHYNDKLMVIIKRSFMTDETNTGFIHARYNFSLLELFSQYEFDETTLIDQRILLGSGLRFKVMEGIFVGIGGMYENEQLSNGSINSEIKSTNYISFSKKITDNIHFRNVGYYQPGTKTYRILNDASLSFTINRNLKINLIGNWRYDRRPPESLNPLDYQITNSLSWEF